MCRMVSLVLLCKYVGKNIQETSTESWMDVMQAKLIFFSCALGNKCRTGQSLQQQTEETVEAIEICGMLRKEGKLIRMRWRSKTNESNTILNGVIRCLGVCVGISYPPLQF